MKVTNKKLKPGLTLIELTVVIVVLLALISVLFIGATAWRNGANRANCILNLRNIHQGVGSFVNIQNIPETATVSVAAVRTAEFLPATARVCPQDSVAYTITDAAFDPAVSFGTCTNFAGAPDNHVFDPAQ